MILNTIKKYIDPCSITGVRRAESKSRKQRTTIEVKNKTTLKKNKELIDSYFEEHCQSVGNQSIIQLKPIIDWTDQDVWDYIHKHNLPINSEYELTPRVGCIICPKANLDKNYIYLLKYPKLIDAFILAKEKRVTGRLDNKIRWEQRSFKQQTLLYLQMAQSFFCTIFQKSRA